MAPPTPAQLRWRRRIELVIRLAEPGLNLLLGAGDRLSRIVDRSPREALPSGSLTAIGRSSDTDRDRSTTR